MKSSELKVGQRIRVNNHEFEVLSHFAREMQLVGIPDGQTLTRSYATMDALNFTLVGPATCPTCGREIEVQP